MTERYTLKLDRYSSHRQIAAWLTTQKARFCPGRPCVVLDIGCAQGFLGRLLSPTDFRLYGVDADPSAVTVASPLYCDAQQADIEGPLTFRFAEPADVMVLADVLEHTRDPADCLTRLCQEYLRPGAWVVISLPNMAHGYIRLSLLAGRFEYADRGLLDRTHLRFFTRASARRLVRECGLRIEETASTPTPLPLVFPLFGEGRLLWPLHWLNGMCARLWPTLLEYQTLLYCIYSP